MKSEFDPELITAYLDGELTSEADRELVERHLAETSADAQMLDDFREIGTLLRGLPSETTPSGLRDAVRNQIERETLLSQPSEKSRRPLRRSRIVQMVASVSLLMLISTVGTFFYMSKQLSSKSDTSALVMMEASPQSSEIETDRLAHNFATAHKENDLAVKDGNGDVNGNVFAEPTSEKIVALPKSRSMKMSKVVPAAPALKELRAAKPAPPAMVKATEEIPPLPAVLSKKSIKYINKLASSPKLQGILEPGELVRYVTSNSLTQDVSVVELSVVDVEEAFGNIQVLLSNNQIVPASQVQMADSDSDGMKDSVAEDKPTSAGVPSTEKQKEKQDGMIALYVEASQEQVLNSLVQLDGLKNIRQVYVGSVPNLTESSYGVEAVAGNKTGLKKFEINRETASSPLVSADKKSKDQPVAALGAPLMKSKMSRADTAPRWRVLGNLNELDEMSLAGNSASFQTDLRKGLHKEAMTKGKRKKLSSATPAGENKNKKAEHDANGDTSFPFAQSVDSFSYQVPVRLTPGNKQESNSRRIAGKKKKPTKQIPENRLRLLLIISLNEET